MSSLRNNMRKWCIQWRLHKDLCIPFFLAPKTMKSSRTCKTSDNEHLGYLILAPLICCCFICLCGFQIEIVEEARTFCILQLHKESTGYSRQEKSMTVIWSTSHCNSSWTTFTYINCWLKHNRLIQVKC